MEIRDYFTILRRRWATIAVVFVCLMGIFTVYLGAKEKATFTATSKLGVLRESRAVSDADREILRINQGGYSYYTREALLKSKHVLDTAAVVYLAVKGSETGNGGDMRAFWRDSFKEDALAGLIRSKGLAVVETRQGRIISLDPNREKIEGISSLLGSVRVSKPEERAQLINLTAQSVTEPEAMLLANALAKGAVIYSRVEALNSVRKMGEEVEARMTELAKQKEGLDVAHTTLSNEEKVQTRLQADIARLEGKLGDNRNRLEEIDLRRKSLLAHEHFAFTPLASAPDDEGLTSPILEELRGDIIALDVSTKTKTFVWREQNPQLQRMREQLAELQEQYNKELDRVRSVELRKLSMEERQVENHLAQLTRDLDEKSAQVERVTKTVSKLGQLEGDLGRYGEIQRQLNLQIPRQRGYYALEDVADGGSPAAPQWPRSIGLFALVSLILSVAGAFLVEYSDTNLRTDYDIRRYINIPCISLFEEVKGGSPFILRGSPKDPASENFNMAASIVRTYLTERNFKTLAICSAIPKEGKTTIASNVAVAMARKGLRVAIVDADLRIPQIHEMFSISNARGLSSILKGDIKVDQVDEVLIKTELETLVVLPSGPVPEGPNMLLESQNMVDLVNALRAKFDVVLFDTPPITSVGDTLTLARLVDTNLLVVKAGLSDRRSVVWAKQMLSSVRGEICGAVLNFVRRRQVSAYYYYYSYYHSSSGSRKSKSLRGKD